MMKALVDLFMIANTRLVTGFDNPRIIISSKPYTINGIEKQQERNSLTIYDYQA